MTISTRVEILRINSKQLASKLPGLNVGSTQGCIIVCRWRSPVTIPKALIRETARKYLLGALPRS
jgi:hypothetical protein